MTRKQNHDTANERHYDAIVIGSGMGGLSTASLLASVGRKKVLVLESHFKLGGFLHSFRRKSFVWDPGVHYIGEMQTGSLTRRCMDLVTGGEVQWHKIQSDYERLMFPNATFDIPAGKEAFEKRLIERFPNERANIVRYFKDVIAVQNWSHRWFFSKQFSGPVASMISFGKKLPLANTQDYVEQRFNDPLLRAIVTAQWPDYGTPPTESAFGIHGTVQADFFNGGYYPIGGSQTIADSAAEVIQRKGGRCLVNHPVKEILIENNRAKGVVVEHKGKTESYFAPLIISNAGARTTFDRMIPEGIGNLEKDKLKQVKRGTSAVILFLGLNDDPRKHGFDDCNYWIYDSLDYAARLNPDQSIDIGGAFLSFGSMRDPSYSDHVAQIVSFSREDQWEAFSGQPWMKRGESYEAQKADYAEALLAFVEERLPGLRNIVEYQELSSPLTVKSFTGHAGGAIYGQECDANRLNRDQWSIGTSVKNLYLTGSDVGLPGVNGALMAGVMTAGKLLGWLGMPRILTQAFSNRNSDG